MKNSATPEIHPLIRQRWSPRAFANLKVEEEKLLSILEAGRWAASAFNEQPWRFVIGHKGDEKFQKILLSLVKWNQGWADMTPILILNLAKQTFSHNGNPNGTASYDLGQAVANMAIEAVHQGLHMHQMSGFDAKKAAITLKIPDGLLPISVSALGYLGDPEDLPEDMAQAEKRKRERKEINDLLL